MSTFKLLNEGSFANDPCFSFMDVSCGVSKCNCGLLAFDTNVIPWQQKMFDEPFEDFNVVDINGFNLFRILSPMNTLSNNSKSVRNLTEFIPGFERNVASLVNSGIFITAFIVFYIVLIYLFVFKGRNTPIKRNQKYLLVLICILVFIQTMCLIFRTVYNGLAFKYIGAEVVTMEAQYVLMMLFAGLFWCIFYV